jgi:uncharacterized coiled-coil protein SlyX
MANPRLDRLEQQLSNLVTMCEVLMKKMEKNNETMKANNAKLDALVAKFDNCSDDNNDELHCYEQSQMVPEEVNNLVNPQDLICHVEVSPPCAIVPIQAQLHHYSKIAQSPPTIKSPCCNHLKLVEWLPRMQTKTIDNKEKIRVLRSPSQFWLCSMTTMLAEVEALQPSERPPRKRMRGQEAVVKGEKGTNRRKFNIDQQEEANTVINQLTHAFILSHRRHMGDFHETYNSASHNTPHEEEKFQGIMGRNIIAGKMRKFSKALTNLTHLHLHVMLIMLSMHVMPLTTGFEFNWLFNGPGRKMKTIRCRTLRTRSISRRMEC